MKRKIKSAVITHRVTLPKQLGELEMVHHIDRAAIQYDYQQFVDQNPDFSDTDPNDDQTIETYFTEQAIPHGDQLEFDHFKQGISIYCANINQFKDYLFARWLKSQRDMFNVHMIYEDKE